MRCHASQIAGHPRVSSFLLLRMLNRYVQTVRRYVQTAAMFFPAPVCTLVTSFLRKANAWRCVARWTHRPRAPWWGALRYHFLPQLLGCGLREDVPGHVHEALRREHVWLMPLFEAVRAWGREARAERTTFYKHRLGVFHQVASVEELVEFDVAFRQVGVEMESIPEDIHALVCEEEGCVLGELFLNVDLWMFRWGQFYVPSCLRRLSSRATVGPPPTSDRWYPHVPTDNFRTMKLPYHVRRAVKAVIISQLEVFLLRARAAVRLRPVDAASQLRFPTKMTLEQAALMVLGLSAADVEALCGTQVQTCWGSFF